MNGLRILSAFALYIIVLCSVFAQASSLTMKRIDLIKVGGFQAGEFLVTSEVAVPTPSETEVLIDIHASAVNPIDWKQAEYNFMIPKEVSSTKPCALGCDVAGIVVGPVSSPLLGKRVVTYLGADKTNFGATRGAFADKVVSPADLVFEIPEGISFAEATTLPVTGLTATLLIEAIQPVAKVGEFVVIYGSSSSVGFYAVQLAKKYGYKVIAVASGKHKEAALELGADFFVDYRSQDVKEAVTEIVKASPGTPLNGAMDPIGSEDTFGTCAYLVSALGDTPDGTPRIVSSTSFGPDGPDGVKRAVVLLGDTVETDPGFIRKTFPSLWSLPKLQPVLPISGPVDAKTVEEGFQISKSGVSGEKIVFVWTK